MNMEALIVYKSKYGHTKQVAEWLAAELNAKAFDFNEIEFKVLEQAKTIVYAAGIYASGFDLPKEIIEQVNKNLIILITGASDPKETDYSELYTKNFPTEFKEKVKIFHIQTGINYKKLSFGHKILMRLIRGSFRREYEKNPSKDLSYVLENYLDEYDFSKKEDVLEIADYVRKL